MGGPLVTRFARDSGARILPVDSEHSAVFQALKRWAPTNDFWRQVAVWALCVIIALATSFIQGDLLQFLGSWRAGTMSIGDVLAYGSIIWGAAQSIYNLYWKAKIAKAESVSQSEIAKANSLSSKSMLKVGQKLQIPQVAKAATTTTTAARLRRRT